MFLCTRKHLVNGNFQGRNDCKPKSTWRLLGKIKSRLFSCWILREKLLNFFQNIIGNYKRQVFWVLKCKYIRKHLRERYFKTTMAWECSYSPARSSNRKIPHYDHYKKPRHKPHQSPLRSAPERFLQRPVFSMSPQPQHGRNKICSCGSLLPALPSPHNC